MPTFARFLARFVPRAFREIARDFQVREAVAAGALRDGPGKPIEGANVRNTNIKESTDTVNYAMRRLLRDRSDLFEQVKAACRSAPVDLNSPASIRFTMSGWSRLMRAAR